MSFIGVLRSWGTHLGIGSGRPRDPNAIEFKIMMEVRDDNAPGVGRALAQAQLNGWSAAPCPSDCSHNAEGGRGNFTRISSPMMSVGGGALDQIARMIDAVSRNGSTCTPTSAVRLSVRDSELDARGVTNLVNMHLANEPILYRLGQAGGAGRSVDHKMGYAAPLSTYFSSTAGRQKVGRWRNTLRNHLCGLNTSQSGMLEFRYLDSTFNTAAMQNNVKLVLNMVAAASANRGDWKKVYAVRSGAPAPVDGQAWKTFVSALTGDEAFARDLRQQFESAGGRID